LQVIYEGLILIEEWKLENEIHYCKCHVGRVGGVSGAELGQNLGCNKTKKRQGR